MAQDNAKPDAKPDAKPNAKPKVRLARLTRGSRVVDPFTQTAYTPEARIAVEGGWLDAQVEHGLIEFVED